MDKGNSVLENLIQKIIKGINKNRIRNEDGTGKHSKPARKLRKKLSSRLNQVENRISSLEDEAEGKQIILIVTGKEHAENVGHYQKTNSSNYTHN